MLSCLSRGGTGWQDHFGFGPWHAASGGCWRGSSETFRPPRAIRLGPGVKCERICNVRAVSQPKGAAADPQGGAAPGTGGCGSVQPGGARAPVLHVVGPEAGRILSAEAVAARGDRWM